MLTLGDIVSDESSEYKIVAIIGNGSFGEVYKIEKTDTKEIFALKTIRVDKDHKELKAINNEGNLALKISHNNSIKYYYYHDGLKFEKYPPYIIMEYANQGTLEELIKNRKNNFFNNEELKEFYIQLINGMDVINKELIHRDIKPDNILISNDTLKITDFGLAKVISENTRNSTFKGFGCLKYFAPECFTSDKNTIQMDIYSMGFVFYQLATLKHPFHDKDAITTDWKSLHTYTIVPDCKTINNSISITLNQLIINMIKKKITDRFKNWDEIRDFLKKDDIPKTENTSIVDGMLQRHFSSENKASSDDILRLEKEKQKNELIKLITFQFNDGIMIHINKLIDEFNARTDQKKISISPDRLSAKISFPSGKKIQILLKEITDNHYDISGQNLYWIENERTQYKPPMLNNKKILAWGYIKADDETGYNLVLVEEKDEVYGNWFLLEGFNNFSYISKESRPEPIAFDLGEIGEQIESIHGTNLFRIEVNQIDDNVLLKLKGFISQYIT